jgi:hypothetical protein
LSDLESGKEGFSPVKRHTAATASNSSLSPPPPVPVSLPPAPRSDHALTLVTPTTPAYSVNGSMSSPVIPRPGIVRRNTTGNSPHILAVCILSLFPPACILMLAALLTPL